jgi:hypothetical protein
MPRKYIHTGTLLTLLTKKGYNAKFENNFKYEWSLFNFEIYIDIYIPPVA